MRAGDDDTPGWCPKTSATELPPTDHVSPSSKYNLVSLAAQFMKIIP